MHKLIHYMVICANNFLDRKTSEFKSNLKTYIHILIQFNCFNINNLLVIIYNQYPKKGADYLKTTYS
jgi:hypothetical protein